MSSGFGTIDHCHTKTSWFASIDRTLVALAVITALLSVQGGTRTEVGAGLTLLGLAIAGSRGSVGPMVYFLVQSSLYRGVALGPIDYRGMTLLVLLGLTLASRSRSTKPALGYRAVLFGAILLAGMAIDYVLRPPVAEVGSYTGLELMFLVGFLLVLGSYKPVSAVRLTAWAMVAVSLVAFATALDFYLAINGQYERYLHVKFNVADLASSNYVSTISAAVAMGYLALALRTTGWRRLGSLALTAAFIIPSVYFLTRSTVVILAVAAPLVILQTRRRLLGFTTMAVAVAALIMFFPTGNLYVQRLGGLVADGGSGRTELYGFALRAIDLNPFAGAGGARLGSELNWQFGVNYAHDLPLELLARYGLLLGGSLMVVLVSFAYRSRRAVLGSVAIALAAASLVEPTVETAGWGLVFICVAVGGIWSESEEGGGSEH